MTTLPIFKADEPRVQALHNNTRPWWDVDEGRLVQAAVLYLLQGCSDWDKCKFCSLPRAADMVRAEFFGGRYLTPAEHLAIFRVNLDRLAPATGDIHSVMVFNAGSFFSDNDNLPEVQEGVARMIAAHPTVRRLIIESRAQLITPAALRRVSSILDPCGKKLTVRIGIETKDEKLRFKVLWKGQTLPQLRAAIAAMKTQGVTSGGYVLLNPCPGLEPQQAIQEANRTIDWLLDPQELGMTEAYMRPVCVAPQSGLEEDWRTGKFQPASLWSTWQVIRRAAQLYDRRVHLLPFKDEPEFLAVPSNHVPQGIPQSLEGALGCDLEFHALFEEYRRSMEPAVLESPPHCACRPD